jgi:hypothetical protein
VSAARSRSGLRDLVSAGRLEQVPVDVEAAWLRLEEAERHVASAELLQDSDMVLAYVALYDGARKAVVAHMTANGYRVANRPGAHEATVLYGRDQLATPASRAHWRRLDEMRRIRNRAEYQTAPITETLVRSDLDHARAIVRLVREALPANPLE